MIKKYNKLIRDKILEIIEDAGEKPYWRLLNKKEYLTEIKKKVLEEAKELNQAKTKKETISEMVDIQELIDVLSLKLGLKKARVKKLQRMKNKKRGGFEKKLFLMKTETKPGK
ncbi:MAG: nucleoside triphosphate pyrophosphohydrolase [Bacteroidota bacterium]|nr:nucleoside triphosphate pyrophosphohydrolase [Bacteroidota bacterium]